MLQADEEAASCPMHHLSDDLLARIFGLLDSTQLRVAAGTCRRWAGLLRSRSELWHSVHLALPPKKSRGRDRCAWVGVGVGWGGRRVRRGTAGQAVAGWEGCRARAWVWMHGWVDSHQASSAPIASSSPPPHCVASPCRNAPSGAPQAPELHHAARARPAPPVGLAAGAAGRAAAAGGRAAVSGRPAGGGAPGAQGWEGAACASSCGHSAGCPARAGLACWPPLLRLPALACAADGSCRCPGWPWHAAAVPAGRAARAGAVRQLQRLAIHGGGLALAGGAGPGARGNVAAWTACTTLTRLLL